MKKTATSILSLLLSVLLFSVPPVSTAMADSGQQQGGYELSTATSVPATVYRPGRYEAGAAIPAGEYVLLSLDTSRTSSYQIHESFGPGAANTRIEYCNFSYNVILTLNEGQVLTFSNCTASPLSEVPQIDHRSGQGYKVGFQIPAGTYRLKSDSYSPVYYIGPRPSTYPGNMDKYAFLSGDSYVTVEDGEYLLLVGCILEEYLGVTEAPAEEIPLPAGYDPAKAYQPGIYHTGTDIPAGDYILAVKPDRTQGQLSQFQILGLDGFLQKEDQVIDVAILEPGDPPRTIHLEDTNVLSMSNCLAFPVSQ